MPWNSPSTEQGAVPLMEQPLVPQEVTGQGALAEKQSRAHSFCLHPEGLQALRMCSFPGWFSNEERQFLFLVRLHNLFSQQLTLLISGRASGEQKYICCTVVLLKASLQLGCCHGSTWEMPGVLEQVF